jgi:hypothetical protein
MTAKWYISHGKGKAFRPAHILLLGSVFIALAAPTLTMATPNAAVHAACSGDARRLCSSAFGDREAVRACMREHHAEWSNRCKAAVANRRSAQGGRAPVRVPRGGAQENGDAAFFAAHPRAKRCLEEAEKLYPTGLRGGSGKFGWQYEKYVKGCHNRRGPG